MPHSASESIACLASALAKAQRALVNPEKTMTATVRGDGWGGQGAERSFRYAPLSAGLEIVRNALGENEIAVMQTTAMDEAKTTVLLKTMLAHSSGEWIASDWPVCPLSDVSSPQRMGAALTYARRYALFTMVGIAGEDDLDAPDLDRVQRSAAPTTEPGRRSNGAGWGRADGRTPRPASGRWVRPGPAMLPAEASAARRAGLVTELAGLASAEDAVTWAKGVLPQKNRLTAEDAKLLEQAFAERMQRLEQAQETPRGSATESLAGTSTTITTPSLDRERPEPEIGSPQENSGGHSESQRRDSLAPEPGHLSSAGPPAAGLPDNDQAPDFPQRLPTQPPSLQKTRRRRDPEHLRFVATQPCLICARTPSDAHHLRFAQVRALGRKASDEYTVPLCRTHHREAHRAANEPAWWATLGFSPLEIAQKLWRKNHGETESDRSIRRRREASNGLNDRH